MKNILRKEKRPSDDVDLASDITLCGDFPASLVANGGAQQMAMSSNGRNSDVLVLF